MVINPTLLVVCSYLRYKKIKDISSELVDKENILGEEILVLTNNSKSFKSIRKTLNEEELGKIVVLEFLYLCKQIFGLSNRNLFFCEKWKIIRGIIEEKPYLNFPLYSQCLNLILKIKKFQKENRKDINLENYSKLGSKLFNIHSKISKKFWIIMK